MYLGPPGSRSSTPHRMTARAPSWPEGRTTRIPQRATPRRPRRRSPRAVLEHRATSHRTNQESPSATPAARAAGRQKCARRPSGYGAADELALRRGDHGTSGSGVRSDTTQASHGFVRGQSRPTLATLPAPLGSATLTHAGTFAPAFSAGAERTSAMATVRTVLIVSAGPTAAPRTRSWGTRLLAPQDGLSRFVHCGSGQSRRRETSAPGAPNAAAHGAGACRARAAAAVG
jgi:hypothetical protein